MRYLLLLVPVLLLVSLLKAQVPRPNPLREAYPVNHADLSQEGRVAAAKYGRAWMSVFHTLGVSGMVDRKIIRDAYDRELAAMLKPLKEGNAADRKLAEAGVRIYQALDYVANQSSAVGSASWDDAALNKLLRIDSPPKDSFNLGTSLICLISDFLGMADVPMLTDPNK